MSLKPLLFLCAVALLARARVLPQETLVEEKAALKLLAERGASNFDAWVQIQKLSEKVQKAHPRVRAAKNQEVVRGRAAQVLGNVTGETTLARRQRSAQRCENLVAPTLQSPYSIPYASELDVRWVGEPYEDNLLVLAAGASPYSLYFSSDKGMTFKPAEGVTEPVASVYISDANVSFVYALSAVDETKNKYLLFVSVDGGASFRALTLTLDFAELKLHPTRADRFLALQPDEVGYSDNDEGTVRVSTVYAFENITHYLALANATNAPTLHGTIVDNNVLAVDFFRPSPEMMKCRASTVYYTKLVDAAYYDSQAVLFRSEHPYGLGAPQQLLVDAFDYLQVNQYIFVTQYLGDPAEGNLQLQVSTDMGVKFQLARFPFEGEARLFTFVDGSEDLSMVSVQKTVAQRIGNCVVVIQGASPVNLTAVAADFTPAPNMSAAVKLVGDITNNGCSADKFASPNTQGNIVVLARGGGCSFYEKVNNAYNAGAAGVVIVNSDNEFTIMGVAAEVDEINYPAIPAFLVRKQDSTTLESKLGENVLLVEEAISEEDVYDTAALYVSGPDGVHYTAALEDIVDFGSLGDYLVDVYKVESSNSTYIANVLLDGQLTSVITFNKGSLWQRLPGDCEQSCNLTIALSVSASMYSIPGPRSAPEAPGLIIVNGHAATDESFEPQLSQVDTFWSNDGGHTWKMVLSGAHDFRILDHGGVVVFVPYGEKTTEISYSVYPADPEPLTVFKSPQEISGVVTEPGSVSLAAYLYYLSDNQWHGVLVDFTPTLPTACTAGDLEPFSNLYAGPLIPAGQAACLDGQSVTYQHRKSCTSCHYGPKFKATLSSTVCQCSFYDFQCYPGFARAYPVDNYTSICARDIYYEIDGHCAPGQATFEVPRYRVIPGDVCTPTTDQQLGLLTPQPVPCHIGSASGHSSSGMNRGLVAFLVLFVLGVSSMLVLIFTLAVSPTFRNKFARSIGIGENQACCCSRMLAHLKIFRQQHNFQYSVLQQDEQRDLAADDDDDDMLFGIGDAQLVSK